MWGWIPNGILAAGPSRVTIRRKPTADIGTAQSIAIRHSKQQRCAPMRTAISDQTEVSKRVAKQHQGLTQDAHGLGRPGRHLVAGGDWVPVATQQLAHFGAGPYPRQKLVVFRRHHVRALYICCSTP
jgi:hypothetical protein